jgi:hypothetical protein
MTIRVFIHRDDCQVATVPGEAPRSSSGFGLVLGTTINGGIKIPLALVHVTAIPSKHFSAEENLTNSFSFTQRTFFPLP